MFSGRQFKVIWAFGLLVTVILLVAAASGRASAQGTGKPVDLQFVSHLQAGLVEQDVFVEKDGKLWRVEGSSPLSTAGQMVYATTKPTGHDPFKVGKGPLGPFEKGAPLDMTLAQWLAAAGTGSYTKNGDQSQLDLSFKNLVPNGVYTLWCSRLTFPPNVLITDEPCGAPDGSQNSLKAASDGTGSFKVTLKALPDSTKETVSLVVLAYHSDGKTYGRSAGDFGEHTHVQLLSVIPVPTGQ